METVKVTGHVVATIIHEDGRWHEIQGPNLVTTIGQNLIAQLLTGAGDPPSHMACGESNATPSKAHTALQGTEHERVAATVVANANVLTISASFGAGIVDEESVGEFGIFNDSSGGEMLARWSTVLFTLPSTSVINVTWRLTIGS